jgi:protein required for attachment to host cells
MMRLSKAAMHTWILVSHRAGAHLLAMDRKTQHLVAFRDWDNPDARLSAQDLEEDRSGRKSDPPTHGLRHSEKQSGTRTQCAEGFACELARSLDEARHQREFDHLVLVAPPRFLGRLRSKLSAPTAATVLGTVSKDLPSAEPEEVERLVQPFLGI